MVLAGIECSPKIFDFRASGIPVQERVDFFDTLKQIHEFFVHLLFCIYKISVCKEEHCNKQGGNNPCADFNFLYFAAKCLDYNI